MRPNRYATALALVGSTLLGCDDSPPTPPPTKPTVTPPASSAETDPQAALTREARGLTKAFGGALKAALMKGMGEGGPASAVKVCNTEAPTIADDVDGAAGWKVGRTSLKLRNPHNAPDDWEREQLERFERDKAAGKPVDELEASAIVESGGAKTFRYMKAIPTAAMCLTCHGSDLASDVEGKLDELYPKDAARGFSVGDLRGAFTLNKAL
ncbi:MAG: DUF3365 domain-containing protein [Polyangiaceae bacterium]